MIQVRLFGVENKNFLNYSYTHLIIDTFKINIFLISSPVLCLTDVQYIFNIQLTLF